jgi:uncharacterized protein YecT (DUF1311 family)
MAKALGILGAVALLLGVGTALAQVQKKSEPSQCHNPTTTMEMRECSYLDFQKTDSELNTLYGRILHKLEPAAQSDLRTAQRLWIQFRDANCEAKLNLWDGGSFGPVEQNSCLEETTKQRIINLKYIYD